MAGDVCVYPGDLPQHKYLQSLLTALSHLRPSNLLDALFDAPFMRFLSLCPAVSSRPAPPSTSLSPTVQVDQSSVGLDLDGPPKYRALAVSACRPLPPATVESFYDALFRTTLLLSSSCLSLSEGRPLNPSASSQP